MGGQSGLAARDCWLRIDAVDRVDSGLRLVEAVI